LTNRPTPVEARGTTSTAFEGVRTANVNGTSLAYREQGAVNQAILEFLRGQLR
jgi:hypothetical protein